MAILWIVGGWGMGGGLVCGDCEWRWWRHAVLSSGGVGLGYVLNEKERTEWGWSIGTQR